MPRSPLRLFALFFFCIGAATTAASGDLCYTPSYAMPDKAPNIFSEQQENDLGDAIAEQVQRNFRIIDDEVTDHLQKIGHRLLTQLPPSSIHFQFYIVDYPQVNALSFPGGRVYITRKLIAASRSEDEVAGVVAHEIGHIITRQSAVDFTRRFQKILGITSIGDRKDIFDKYHQLLDNMARNPGVLKQIIRDTEEEQIIADRVSIYLAKRAGYAPEAYAQFWNRAFEVGSKTGSALSDFFGLTKPEQKRLREMQQLIEQLPAACAGPRMETTQQGFEEWRAAVIAYSGLGHRESLPPAEWKRPLKPHLRGNITHMRFSIDGKHLLAQDSSSIFILSRDPFEVRFRIDAQDAFPSQFTPDSQSVIFHTRQLRIEKWNIEEEKRTDLRELTITNNCIDSRLSPDAKHLACLDDRLELTMFNVSDGSQVFKIDSLYEGFYAGRMYRYLLAYGMFSQNRLGQLEFSPDGRYFLGSDLTGSRYHAYDFDSGKSLNLPFSIKGRLGRSFAFMSGDRLVGVGGNTGEKSAVISFPSGQVQYTFQAGSAQISPATHGDYIILRPIENFPAGVMDLKNNKIFLASKQEALDLYDRQFVSERIDGMVFLFHADQQTALSQAVLPKSPLPRLRATALSVDMNWLAVSENSRGAIWDLRKGERVFLTSNFQGAQFASDNTLLADFPKSGKEERMIARVNPLQPGVMPILQLKDSKAQQNGLYLVEERNNAGKRREDPTLVVSSAETGKELWSKAYPKDMPWTNFNSEDDRAVLLWGAWTDFVKAESKNDPELKSKIESKKERQNDYYIRIVQASTGQPIGNVYVETGMGSFLLRWAEVAGDYIALYDTQNRLLIYSVSSGKRLGQVFGVSGGLSPAAELLVTENEPGKLGVYSLPSMKKHRDLIFTDPLSHIQFSKDGKKLFVLTAGQMTYLFNTEALVTSIVSQSRP